jgi:hypothetical protein
MRRRTSFVMAILWALLGVGQAHAGLVSYWAAEGNANDSVGPNSGILVNGVAFGPGVVGQAFHFDGSSYVQAGTTDLPTGASDRTLDLWFKVDQFNTSESFLAGYGSFGSSDQTYQLGTLGDGRVYFSQWGDALLGPSVGAGRWHNLAAVNTGSMVTLYLDGIAVGTKTMSIDTSSGTNFYIGRIPGSLGDSRRLDGFVDEVKIFDTALSADQIRNLASVPEPTALVPAVIAVCIIGSTMTLCGRRNRVRPSKRLMTYVAR